MRRPTVILHVGDYVRFRGLVERIVAIAGNAVRLETVKNPVAVSDLLAAADFEVVTTYDPTEIYRSQQFLDACQTLGIATQPVHPNNPDDNRAIDRTADDNIPRLLGLRSPTENDTETVDGDRHDPRRGRRHGRGEGTRGQR